MSAGGRIEPLGPERFEDAWRLSLLAFGGDADADPPAPPDGPPRGDTWGVVDRRGRLLGKAVLLDYEQWWSSTRRPLSAGEASRAGWRSSRR